MDRLSIFLSLISGSFITGALVIAAFSLGYYDWWWIGLCAIFGFAMAWPSGYYISRRIKQRDPNWNRSAKGAERVVPDPSKPEL